MVQSDQSTSVEARFFQRELAVLGPDHPPSAWSLTEAQQYCRNWAHRSYENFTVVSYLLPRRLRQDFQNIYAYCRWADNLADEIAEPKESLRLLDWWQQQLLLCRSGRPAHPVLVALQDTIQRHQLPLDPFEHLLSAFRQDQTVNRYATADDLQDYCRRSANPVGRILLYLAQASDGENIALSDQICTSLQLANFCQDLSRDAGINRIYVPQSLCAEHAVEEAMLLRRQPTPELRHMLADWVATTRAGFHAGWPLVDRVPSWLATDVDLFVRGGLAILDAIEQAEYDVWTRRPTVSKFRKLQMLGQSLARCMLHASRGTK
ncbi:MAG: squalene synthase HpnC [Pirellulaceae bacterium]